MHPINEAAPAKGISEVYRLAESVKLSSLWVEMTEGAYYECLEVLPPIYGDGCFYISEMHSTDSHGREVSLEVKVADGRFFGRLAVVPERLLK